MKMLAETVKVSSRFQRSIRIDADINDAEVIRSYICPQSSVEILKNMAKGRIEANESAYTWTGPYGSGKSSLAVILSALLGKDKELAKMAAEAIGSENAKIVQSSFNVSGKSGWRFVPVVGHKGNIETAIINALSPGKRGPKGSALTAIQKEAEQEPNGLFIVIDEMGKFLEAAADGSQDIYIFQQLAELASRSNGKIAVLGVLHQSFAEYARRLTREMRDEWSKVQGRFVDMPLNVAGEELIDLIGRAIRADIKPVQISPVVQKVAQKISDWRPVNIGALSQSLSDCWPLHPITAALLGPISRRRFGQNQRSVFGFLNSSEPNGFQTFLQTTASGSKQLYTPALLWDYLRSNIEPSIMASPDGHRWSLAVDALSRAEAAGVSAATIDIIKSIALIDMFQERSGLVPEKELLKECVNRMSSEELDDILLQLGSWSIILFKKHKRAYSLYEGSDFNIDAAIQEAYDQIPEFDFSQLKAFGRFQPIVAKKHYHKTGALRWINVDLVASEQAIERAKNYTPKSGAFGLVMIVLGNEGESEASLSALGQTASNTNACWPIVASVARNSWFIRSHVKELQALEWIREHNPALGGDTVARREVEARIASIQERLELSLAETLSSAEWFIEGAAPSNFSFRELQSWVSGKADKLFAYSPKINSELVNRIKLSSNSVSALKILLRAMVVSQGKPRLGIEGYPAEGGLFDTLISNTKLYHDTELVAPIAESDPCRLFPLWEVADAYFNEQNKRAVSLNELYDIWQKPPYGVKDGLLPFFAVAYILTRIHDYAAYLEGVYRPSIDDVFIDVLTKSPGDIALRPMNFSDIGQKILAGVCHTLNATSAGHTKLKETSEPLEIARRLVSTVMELPPYILRTRQLCKNTIRLRELVKNANDPNKVLFDDLPYLFREFEENLDRGDVQPIIGELENSLKELVGAYPQLLKELHQLLLSELQIEESNADYLDALNMRAKNIMHVSGDFKLDAFAARLANYKGSIEDIEGIASLAADKPTRDWIDLDVSRARLRLAELSQKFNHIEAYGRVQNREDYRQAVAFMVGIEGKPKTFVQEFTIKRTEQEQVDKIEAKIRNVLNSELGGNRELILAALANLGAELLENPAPAANEKVKGEVSA